MNRTSRITNLTLLGGALLLASTSVLAHQSHPGIDQHDERVTNRVVLASTTYVPLHSQRSQRDAEWPRQVFYHQPPPNRQKVVQAQRRHAYQHSYFLHQQQRRAHVTNQHKHTQQQRQRPWHRSDDVKFAVSKRNPKQTRHSAKQGHKS